MSPDRFRPIQPAPAGVGPLPWCMCFLQCVDSEQLVRQRRVLSKADTRGLRRGPRLATDRFFSRKHGPVTSPSPQQPSLKVAQTILNIS